MRATRWSLYLSERVNAEAFLRPLNASMAADGVDLLYIQEYWSGRFDHLAHRVSVPISAADHGGLAKGVVKWFKRRAFKRAALLYCQTRDECSQVQRYGGRTLLQPNGGDTSFFVPPPKGTVRTQNIVTVARLTNKQKRTSDLIKAMTLLAAGMDAGHRRHRPRSEDARSTRRQYRRCVACHIPRIQGQAGRPIHHSALRRLRDALFQ